MFRPALRILLINDNSAHLNWGAQATVYALRSMLADEFPSLEIDAVPHAWLRRQYRETRLPYDTRGKYWPGGQSWLGRRILHRLSVPVDLFPAIFDDFEYFADLWLEGRAGPEAAKFLAAARSADAVVYNGENSIYRNTLEGCRALFLLWLVKTRLAKPSAIINHTAHLDDVQPRMPAMVAHVFPILDVVTCRESCSFRQIAAMNLPNAELVPDAVFYLGDRNTEEPAFRVWSARTGLMREPYFCVSGSALPASEPRGRWDGRFAELVRGLRSAGGRPVLVAKDPDCLYLEEVAKRTGGIFFGPSHTFHELWPLFRGATFVVSGHYHYVIIAALTGCPFIPLSANNRKMKGVCTHLEWPRTEPFDITDLGSCEKQIKIEAGALARDRSALSAKLRLRSEQLTREAARNATLIRGMLRRTAESGALEAEPE